MEMKAFQYTAIVLSLAGMVIMEESVEHFKCGVRYELAAALRQEGVCSQWKVLHPMCNKDLEVAYSEAAPYVYKESKRSDVKGVVPGNFYRFYRSQSINEKVT